MNSMIRTTLLTLLILGGGAVAVGQKPAAAPAVLAPAEAEKWAGRLRKLVPAVGWTVAVRGDSIAIQRTRPVRFVAMPINAAPSAPGQPEPEPPLTIGPYRVTLRFVPRVSFDEYEARAAVNEASRKEQDRLIRSVTHIPHKFDDYDPANATEEAQLKAYRAGLAKLTWHKLPVLYTPDQSINLVMSQPYLYYVYDEADRLECRAVYDSILRYFGIYDPHLATDRSYPLLEYEPFPPR